MNISQQKNALRQQVKLRLKQMTPQEIAEQSVAVMAQVEALEEFKRAKNILLYASLKTEVQTHNFLQRWSGEKNIYLPVVCGEVMKVGRLLASPLSRHCEEERRSNLTPLVGDCHVARSSLLAMTAGLRPGAFGILEPEAALDEMPLLDLAIIPGLAFDRNNNRMGRGKGYYDKFLKVENLVKVGVCFGCQLLDEVPHEPFDVKMDYVIVN
ncbi:MAG: 5-formyltetrahydrofolate cyclo-ligase [Prevotellaceae bacterium]|jgi:5-formyltetrahydrofolate cyclo-ligase|nr:5-formyltetrahydrofolate cyclo-ligase [Prevotellaceae bacterium]